MRWIKAQCTTFNHHERRSRDFSNSNVKSRARPHCYLSGPYSGLCCNRLASVNLSPETPRICSTTRYEKGPRNNRCSDDQSGVSAPIPLPDTGLQITNFYGSKCPLSPIKLIKSSTLYCGPCQQFHCGQRTISTLLTMIDWDSKLAVRLAQPLLQSQRDDKNL